MLASALATAPGSLPPLCGLLVFFFCRKLFKEIRAAAVILLNFNPKHKANGVQSKQVPQAVPLYNPDRYMFTVFAVYADNFLSVQFVRIDNRGDLIRNFLAEAECAADLHAQVD